MLFLGWDASLVISWDSEKNSCNRYRIVFRRACCSRSYASACAAWWSATIDRWRPVHGSIFFSLFLSSCLPAETTTTVPENCFELHHCTYIFLYIIFRLIVFRLYFPLSITTMTRLSLYTVWIKRGGKNSTWCLIFLLFSSTLRRTLPWLHHHEYYRVLRPSNPSMYLLTKTSEPYFLRLFGRFIDPSFFTKMCREPLWKVVSVPPCILL
jgi:hypothetical protein